MVVQLGTSSFSCVATSLSSPFKPRRGSQLSMSEKPFVQLHFDSQKLRNTKGGLLKQNRNGATANVLYAASQDKPQYIEPESDTSEAEEDHSFTAETLYPTSSSFNQFQGTDGKSGLVSFYNRPYKIKEEVSKSNVQKKQTSLLWFMGPAVMLS